MTPLEIYASNLAVSTGAAQMIEHIDKLKEAGLIAPSEATQRIAAIEEARALTSLNVVLNMVRSELDNANTAQQKKFARQREQQQLGGEPEPNHPTGKDIVAIPELDDDKTQEAAMTTTISS